mmetsp:Transcript_8925/g.22762  ORF Transcript_8925/g.22762 Transcript_8925/m.22762 type:complete len:336 (-) Transcript_8925:78-1085(-)
MREFTSQDLPRPSWTDPSKVFRSEDSWSVTGLQAANLSQASRQITASTSRTSDCSSTRTQCQGRSTTSSSSTDTRRCPKVCIAVSCRRARVLSKRETRPSPRSVNHSSTRCRHKWGTFTRTISTTRACLAGTQARTTLPGISMERTPRCEGDERHVDRAPFDRRVRAIRMVVSAARALATHFLTGSCRMRRSPPSVSSREVDSSTPTTAKDSATPQIKVASETSTSEPSRLDCEFSSTRAIQTRAVCRRRLSRTTSRSCSMTTASSRLLCGARGRSKILYKQDIASNGSMATRHLQAFVVAAISHLSIDRQRVWRFSRVLFRGRRYRALPGMRHE